MTVREGGSAPQAVVVAAVHASACSRGLHQGPWTGPWIYQELECTNGLGDLEYPIDKQGDRNGFKLDHKGSVQVFQRAL
jgi:hypothetical protein